jgi:hypothetical protein
MNSCCYHLDCCCFSRFKAMYFKMYLIIASLCLSKSFKDIPAFQYQNSLSCILLAKLINHKFNAKYKHIGKFWLSHLQLRTKNGKLKVVLCPLYTPFCAFSWKLVLAIPFLRALFLFVMPSGIWYLLHLRVFYSYIANLWPIKWSFLANLWVIFSVIYFLVFYGMTFVQMVFEAFFYVFYGFFVIFVFLWFFVIFIRFFIYKIRGGRGILE